MILESLIGTLAGFIGTGITTYSNYKMRKLDIEDSKARRAHELEMVKAESEARLAEVKANIEVAQVQTEGAVLLEEARAFTESQKQGNEGVFEGKWITTFMNRKDGWRWLTVPLALLLCVLFGISDLIKSLMRSGLTLYALALASWATWRAWDVLQGIGINILDPVLGIRLWEQATEIIYVLAVTLVTWWFGDKRVAKHLMHISQGKKAA